MIGAQAEAFSYLKRKSDCPSVRVTDLGPRGARVETDVFLVRDSTVMLGFGVNAPVGRLDLQDPELHFIHFGEKAEFTRSHAVSIAVDDSIKIRPGTRYRSAMLAGNALIEDIAASLSRQDLQRIAAGKRVTVQMSDLSLVMTPAQIRSVAMMRAQLGMPVSNRFLNNDCTAEDVGVSRPTTAQTYFEFQVEKQAAPTDYAVLVYPQELSARGVEGSVLAQFVVTEDGLADLNTFKVLETSHDLFTEAVKNTLPNMRFTAAELGGKRVKELVQMPFVFKLGASRGDSIRRASNLLPALPSSQVYSESQVDKPVRNPDGSPVPKTVPAEVVKIFGGEQLLEFVVNADGSVAPETARIIHASDPRRTTLGPNEFSSMRFIPAELGGKRVRQLVRLATPMSIRPSR